MHFYILLLLIIHPPSSWGEFASFNGYHYTEKDLKISDYYFQKYARPQLQNMLKEYFFVINKLNPLQENQYLLIEKNEKIHNLWKKIPLHCHYRPEKSCLNTFQDVYRELKDFNNLIFQTKNFLMSKGKPSSNTKVNFKNFSSFHSSSYVLHLSLLDSISFKIYKALHIFEMNYMAVKAPAFLPLMTVQRELDGLFSEIKLYMEMSLTSLIDKELKDDFDLVWVYFFKPIHEHVVQKSSSQRFKNINEKLAEGPEAPPKNFLLRNLEELNISWNTFHMRLLKKRKNFPSDLKNTIITMHNRWNSILKIILNN